MTDRLKVAWAARDAIAPYAGNPRSHDAAQVERIARSIQEFGFANPILVDANNAVIAGHGRLLAAERLGLDQVPVIRLGHLTADQARALRIADNKLTELAGWDDALLAQELHALNAEGFDLELTGFSDEELDELMAPLADNGDQGSNDSASAEAEDRQGSLAERFGVAPFSVLNAREGWWQDRKRAWIDLGIQSELGRGGDSAGSTKMPSAELPAKAAQIVTGKATAEPGGSKMPAADYSRSKARGDGRGRAVPEAG